MFKLTLKEKRKIRKIKFIKSCRLTQNKLFFEFGDIYRMYQYKKRLLGNYRVEITFGEHNRHEIKVYNKTPILYRNRYEGLVKIVHPHVLHNTPCLGYTRDTIIKQSLFRGDYIQVIIQFLQFLKTYTSNDCYYNMSYWANTDTNEKGERIYNG